MEQMNQEKPLKSHIFYMNIKARIGQLKLLILAHKLPEIKC
jgi:hypothetical protein